MLLTHGAVPRICCQPVHIVAKVYEIGAYSVHDLHTHDFTRSVSLCLPLLAPRTPHSRSLCSPLRPYA
jgi:hypothetical protein